MRRSQGAEHHEHPDWFFAPPKLDPEGHINWDAQIDLGYDPARDWVEQATQRVFPNISSIISRPITRL